MLRLKPNRVVKPIVLVLKVLAESERAREIDIIRRLPGYSTATIHDNLVKAVMQGLARVENGYYIITEEGKAFLKHAVEEMKRIVESIDSKIK